MAVEVLLVVPHREEREQLGVARDLELGNLEEVVDGLALDIGEELEALDLSRGEPVLAREIPIEIFDFHTLRHFDVLSDV